MNSVHRSVLLNEAIEGLNLKDRATLVDGTFGGGGHSLEICKKYPGVKIIALDQDQGAFQKARSKFENVDCEISFVNENFRNIDEVLKEKGIGSVDGIIFDLGLSSDQLSPPAGGSGRGFSFLKDEPLLMTMKDKGNNLPSPEDLTAMDIVNTWEEENLVKIFIGYGEEKFAKRIARAIVEGRERKKIETTFELVEIIRNAVPGVYRMGGKRSRLHFATRVFQALRIAVNDELGALEEGLKKGFEALGERGRIATITFHSLEDRIVKRFYKAKEKEGRARLVNKKVILATDEEIINNPRSRSGKLRILEKIK